MKTKHIASILILAAVLTGCAGKKSDVTIKTDEMTMKVSEGQVKLPKDFPFSPYPAAANEGFMESNNNNASKVVSVSFSSNDPSEKVIEYYKGELQKLAWQTESSTVMPNFTCIIAKKDKKTATIAVSSDGDKTTVSITVSEDNVG